MENRTEFISDEFDALVENLGQPKLHGEAKQKILAKYGDQLGAMLDTVDKFTQEQLIAVTALVREYPEAFLDDLERLVRQPLYVWNDKIRQIFEAIGPESMEIGLELIGDIDPNVSSIGGEILRTADGEGVEHLRMLLETENPSKKGIEILAEIDPNSHIYFKNQLEQVLGSPDQLSARYAIDAIESIGDYGIPLLLELLASPDPFKQQNATNALISIGEIAVPDLVEELDSPIPSVQQNSIRALKEIGFVAVPFLKQALESSSQLMVQNANTVLRDPKMKSKDGGLLKRFRRVR